MTNREFYLQKAAMYDLLSMYFKYSDPRLHIHYYQKHLKYMQKGVHSMRDHQQERPAQVRVLHAVPDAPNVDIYVNGNLVLSDIAFKDITGFMPLPAGKYHIDIYPAGTSVSTVISKKVTVEAGSIYTLAAVGQGNKLQLLPYVTDPFVPHGETKVRFIHLSPDAPAVDIAVAKGDVIFPKVSFKQATDYLGLTPMTVNLEVRAAGTKDAVLSVPNVSLQPNQSYTIFAVGLLNDSPELDALLVMG
ncbi:DUF4397 domain-containing protein [Rossellomorea vietnamensis]|uniref:DUF4397 domain-containing protein n=1 Tax=Rossellomorea vietnamensis TaxID=218284 RepID=A0A5D4KGZ9_9BACI|nr:DUF4397 domain-containing protein [Rossellomorea vietnamensis]TYR76561.1 DUF4397 domain-containing protein [Rossellomorea vietnamensis]